MLQFPFGIKAKLFPLFTSLKILFKNLAFIGLTKNTF